MLLASSVVANPQLDTSNPTGFFTNVAMALFQQMNLHDFNGNLVTVTNIPIYEDPAQFGGTNINYYTPAVHRVLQLAANLFDATTNRFIDGGPTNYPTVFRPIFRSQAGIATISGYEEVTNPAPAFYPMLYPSNFVKLDQPENSSINIYGAPWVISAKKGFPNFNEFSMANALSVTRKLIFTNLTGLAHPPWTTNQIFDFSITNTFGLEAWNSYTNSYGRPLRLVATNELSIIITNEFGVPLLEVSSLAFGTDIALTDWPGWAEGKSDNSFKVPLSVTANFTNGVYLSRSPFQVPLEPPQWDATVVPRLWMVLQFNLRYVLIDTSANRVIDFVNLSDSEPAINIDTVLSTNATGRVGSANLSDQWATNLTRTNSGPLVGVLNQIEASEGLINVSDWNAPDKSSEENLFRLNLNGNGSTNTFQAPYSPKRTIYQMISLQANDPLVHYTLPDLLSTNGFMANFNTVTIAPKSPLLGNLTNLNFAYNPWGGYHLPGGSPLNPTIYDFDIRVKDPAVQRSDDWNFPTGESLAFDWLGRVHRGTPWQTVFLKTSNQSLSQWSAWNNDNIVLANGNSISLDAAFTYPNNDWQVAGLWAQWLNTNDLTTLLSINNTDPNAWAARLDGLTALTNSSPAELDPITITSNSPAAGFIAQAVQTARANIVATNGPFFPNQLFQRVGDVLATPQLSVASPFLNTNSLSTLSANGITDEALEIIPTQLLPLLRLDSFGQIAATNGQLQLSFSGYDGHSYAIQASSNLTDWVNISTNCPTNGIFGITNTPTPGQQYFRSVLLH